jgi:glycosyltransferase involved in cell wall biosynthesis
VDYEFNVGSVNRDCVYIIPPYIPKPEYFQSRSAESENSRKKKNLIMLGMMARWDPLKCHAKLLRVLKHCNEQDIRDYNLILAGKGATQLNKDLLAQINELGLQDKVLLMGEIADKETFFSAIDMHILLSKDESFGLVTVEALLRSIPSIMTETGIAPELTDNINFRTCSHHDDARVIAAKVIELLDATITNYGKCKSNDEKIGYTPKSLTRFTEDNLKLYRQIYDKYKK